MSTKANLQIGISFHSFTHEYCSFIWSFEDLMEKAAQLGGGVEIVGPTHHRGFPEVGDEFERSFKSAVQRYGLTPTSYGSYADPFMLSDRNLTDDELVDYTIPQIKGASKLGFPVVRLQYFTHTIVERLLPYAQKYNLKLGYELHQPLTIESDETQMLKRQVERISSEHLGLIPDCGIFARSVPKFMIERARRGGVSEAIIARALALWADKVPLDKSLVELQALGLEDSKITAVEGFWGSVGQSDPQALRTIMPYIVHMHGKFFSMENGDEPDVRFEEVVHALLAGGYRGWISSEFEGDAPNSLEMVMAHQAMLRRYVASYAA